jgi:hypothetical protein
MSLLGILDIPHVYENIHLSNYVFERDWMLGMERPRAADSCIALHVEKRLTALA